MSEEVGDAGRSGGGVGGVGEDWAFEDIASPAAVVAIVEGLTVERMS